MKINKVESSKKVTSSSKVRELKAPVKACDQIAVVADCKYDAAIGLISAAIESLAEIAKDDQIAKDSIANLGVVMLDLKGGCQ